MKKIFISFVSLTVVLSGVAYGLINSAHTASGNYKAADFAVINDRQIVVTANQNGLEILEIKDNVWRKLGEAKLLQVKSQPNGLLVRQEADGYYAYLAAGTEVFRFEITSLTWPVLLTKQNLGSTVYDIAARPNHQTIIIAGAFGLKQLENKHLGTIRNLWQNPVYGLSINPAGNLVANGLNEVLEFNSHLNLTKREYTNNA